MSVPMTIPTVEMPPPLATAVQTLRKREQDLRAAEAAVAAAHEGVTAARASDIADVASARETGRPDPRAAKHEEKAEAALAAAEREAEIMRARVAQVRNEYERLSEELRPKWKAAVEREWRKLDTLQRRRARELGAGFERTQELQACWRYLHTLDTNPADAERRLRKAMAPASAVAVDLSGVLEAIEDGSADTVIERVNREWSEWMIASEATSRAAKEAAEQARLEREAEMERVRVRREALS